jgi:hypothetical protein
LVISVDDASFHGLNATMTDLEADDAFIMLMHCCGGLSMINCAKFMIFIFKNSNNKLFNTTEEEVISSL